MTPTHGWSRGIPLAPCQVACRIDGQLRVGDVKSADVVRATEPTESPTPTARHAGTKPCGVWYELTPESCRRLEADGWLERSDQPDVSGATGICR